MRTMLFLTAGFLLMAAALIVEKLFSEHFPMAPDWVLGIAISLWLTTTGINMWIGLSKAGYSVAEELPVLLVLFLLPVSAAVLVRWRMY